MHGGALPSRVEQEAYQGVQPNRKQGQEDRVLRVIEGIGEQAWAQYQHQRPQQP
jgi:hypothetical protein